MPQELPGFYWDEERQRYFPLASKPRVQAGYGPSNASSSVQSDRPTRPLPSTFGSEDYTVKRRRVESRNGVWQASEKLRTTDIAWRRSKTMHEIASEHVAITSREYSHHVAAADVTAFCSVFNPCSDNGPNALLVGDAQGWLHSLNGTSENMNYTSELKLSSAITSVCSWGTRHVVSSFGSPCKILVRDTQPTEMWTLLGLPERTCHDVRMACLYDRSLALGAAKRAIYLPNIDSGGGLQVLETGSDVFAVHLQEHLVYTGARNGFINRFDTRLSTRNRQTLLDHRFERTTSSIAHLKIIHEWELLVSTVRGDLETHDLRFLRSTTPAMQFAGHVNTYMNQLGLAVDPAEDFLFAAGQDCFVRAWSLRTGKQIELPLRSTPSQESHLLGRTFDAPVAAMQVTESDKGLCLWAAASGELHQYPFGRHGHII